MSEDYLAKYEPAYNQNVKRCHTCGRLKENTFDKFICSRNRKKQYKLLNQCKVCANEAAKYRYRMHQRREKYYEAAHIIMEGTNLLLPAALALVERGCMLCGSRRRLEGMKVDGKPQVICNKCLSKSVRQAINSKYKIRHKYSDLLRGECKHG